MRVVKVALAYDGTRYRGWQIQPGGPTLQETVERALAKIHGHPVRVAAASRTDTGVHALGQVIHFETDSRLPDRVLKKAMDSNLPDSIAVRVLRTVGGTFHARFTAKAKRYRYTIYTGRTKPVFDRPFVLWLPHRLDVRGMARAAKLLTGRHDFASFSTAAGEKKSTVRNLISLRVTRRGDYVFIDAKGEGFLYNMVRIIAGTLVQVGFGKLAPADMPRILAAKDRRRAGPTADARGLVLVDVIY